MAKEALIKSTGLIYLKDMMNAPEGTLLEATNAIIERPGEISRRYGWRTTSVHNGNGTVADAIQFYKDYFFGHSGTALFKYNIATPGFTAFSGSHSNISSEFNVRFAQSKESLFATTDAGVMQIDGLTGTTGSFYRAGPPTALAAREASLSTSSSTATKAIAPLHSVAYRFVFGFYDTFGNLNLGAPSGRVLYINTSSTLYVAASVQAIIPRDIGTEWAGKMFLRIYRSENFSGSTPSDDLYLVRESYLTSGEITAGITTAVEDNVFDELLGPPLYTNANQEGILQANNRPPLACDMAEFSNSLFYANTRGRERFTLQMISVPRARDTITIGGVVFTFVDGSVAANFASREVQTYESGTISENIRKTSIDLCYCINLLSSASNVYATYASGPDDSPGIIQLESRNINAASNYTLIADTSSITVAIGGLVRAGTTVTVTSTGHPFVVGDTFVLTSSDANFASGTKTVVTVPTNNTFTYTEAGAAVASTLTTSYRRSTAAGESWSPVLPTSGSTIYMKDDYFPGRVYFSKESQPSAVPEFNYLDIGESSKPIYRIIPLRDALYIMKEDGIFKVRGANTSDFSWSSVDETVRCYEQDSWAEVGNKAYGLTSKGIAAISEYGVEIVSSNIDLIVQGIIYSETARSQLSSFGLEQKGAYGFNYIGTTYVYTGATKGWTSWSGGAVVSGSKFAADKSGVLYVTTAGSSGGFPDIRLGYQDPTLTGGVDTDGADVDSSFRFRIVWAPIFAGDRTSVKNFLEVVPLMSGSLDEFDFSCSTNLIHTAALGFGASVTVEPNIGNLPVATPIGLNRNQKRAFYIAPVIDTLSHGGYFVIHGIIVRWSDVSQTNDRSQPVL